MNRVQDNSAMIKLEKETVGCESLLVNTAMHGLGSGWVVDLVM